MKRFAHSGHVAFGVLLLGSVVAAACGGTATPAEAPLEDGSAEAAGDEPTADEPLNPEMTSTKSFDELSLEERKTLMKEVVHPAAMVLR